MITNENKIKIAVVGDGTMGHGIAEVFAKAGHEVTIIGLNADSLDYAKKRILLSLNEFVEMHLFEADQIQPVLSRISFTTKMEAAKDAKMVIEALPENMELKNQTFGTLEKVCAEDAILATASGHSVSEVISQVKKRDRVIATHFWFPPQLLPLVEVCGAPETSRKTIEYTCDLLRKIGKKPAIIDKEIDGFIGNRIQFAALREAWALYAAGVASADAIDSVVRYSIGRRYSVTGPIESADLAGLPVMVNFADYLQPSLCNDKKPPEKLYELMNIKGGTVYNRSREEVEKLTLARKKELFRWLASDMEEDS